MLVEKEVLPNIIEERQKRKEGKQEYNNDFENKILLALTGVAQLAGHCPMS